MYSEVSSTRMFKRNSQADRVIEPIKSPKGGFTQRTIDKFIHVAMFWQELNFKSMDDIGVEIIAMHYGIG